MVDGRVSFRAPAPGSCSTSVAASSTSPPPRRTRASGTSTASASTARDGPGSPARTARTGPSSPDGRFYADTWSDVATPPRVWVSSQDGTKRFSLEENAQPADPRLRARRASSGSRSRRRTERPSTPPWSSPPDFDPQRRYPVVVSVYGGPHAQTVTNTWGQTSRPSRTCGEPRVPRLVARQPRHGGAGHGLRVRDLPRPRPGRARGPARRRRAPEVAALRRSRPDRDHRLVLRRLHDPLRGHERPGVFRAAVAGAPVTDWKNYDSIYTERYMGHPEATRRGTRRARRCRRRRSSTPTSSSIHGSADDNVHLANTMAFVVGPHQGGQAVLAARPPAAAPRLPAEGGPHRARPRRARPLRADAAAGRRPGGAARRSVAVRRPPSPRFAARGTTRSRRPKAARSGRRARARPTRRARARRPSLPRRGPGIAPSAPRPGGAPLGDLVGDRQQHRRLLDRLAVLAGHERGQRARPRLLVARLADHRGERAPPAGARSHRGRWRGRGRPRARAGRRSPRCARCRGSARPGGGPPPPRRPMPGSERRVQLRGDRLAPPARRSRPAHEARGQGVERAPPHRARWPPASPAPRLRARPSRTPSPDTIDVDRRRATSIRVSITRPPPTTESRRSAFRPGTPARFLSRSPASPATMSCSRRRVRTVAVQARDRVARGPLVDLRQVPQRAPGAHQLLAARERPQPRRVEDLPRVLAQAPHLARRRRVRLQESVRDPQRAERHAHRPEQPPVAEACDLQAPASQVEERPVLHRQAPDRPEEAVAGLLEARQGADRDPQLAPDAPDEGGPVRRRRAGPRCPRPRSAARRSHGRWSGSPAGPRRRARATRRGCPGAVQLAHEPERGAAAGQDVQVPPGLLPVHHHAAGVRADVDHRHRRGGRRAGRPDAWGPAHGRALNLPESRPASARIAERTQFASRRREPGGAWPRTWQRTDGYRRHDDRPTEEPGGATRRPSHPPGVTSRRSAARPRRSASGCRRRCAAGSSRS